MPFVAVVRMLETTLDAVCTLTAGTVMPNPDEGIAQPRFYCGIPRTHLVLR
jgi:hypothetical protein